MPHDSLQGLADDDNMLKPVVIFDIDGVLCDFVRGWSALAVDYGFLEDEYSTGEQMLWRGTGMSSLQRDTLWKEVDHRQDFWYSLPSLVNGGDLSAMWKLRKYADIWYYTNRFAPLNVTEQTINWLYDHALPSPHQVVCTEDKAIVVRNRFGPRVVAAIDDSPKNLAAYLELEMPIYAMDRMYNRDIRTVARVSSVAEFCHMALLDAGKEIRQ